MFRLARLPELTRSWHSGTNERLDTASLVSRRRIATHVGLRSIRREWCHERRASSTTVHPRNPDGPACGDDRPVVRDISAPGATARGVAVHTEAGGAERVG